MSKRGVKSQCHHLAFRNQRFQKSVLSEIGPIRMPQQNLGETRAVAHWLGFDLLFVTESDIFWFSWFHSSCFLLYH